MVLVLDGKTDLNKITLTGVRAITLIGLLAVAPRSMEEIRNAFLEYKIMDESQSDDILRIDLNTIKSFGCEISRSSAKTGYKYVLQKHPFTIQITEEDIKVLKKFFNKIKTRMEVSTLIECDTLIKKIAEYIYGDKTGEKFVGISPLICYDINMVKELNELCINNYTVKLMYKKAYVNEPEEKNIVAQKLVINNDKLYLYGYDLDKKVSSTLLYKRIKSVVSKQPTRENYSQNPATVRFVLKNYDKKNIKNEEAILESKDSEYLVEGKYFNEFTAIQRILSFGPACTVIEPVELRTKIISKLKEMRKLYDEEK